MNYLENVRNKRTLEDALRTEEHPHKINHQKFNQDRIQILLMSDEHLGHRCYDKDMHERILEHAYNKGWYILHLGDAVECATKNSVGAGVFEQEQIVDTQISNSIALYKPFVDDKRFMGMHSSNHPDRIYKDTGLDVSRHMCREMNAKYLGIAKAHILRVGNQTYTMYTTHGSSGAMLPYTKIKGALDMEKIIDVEIYAMGHCFDKETEILTKNNGWVKGFKLNINDIVATINPNTLQFEWNNILKMVRSPKGTQLVQLKSITTDLVITEKHRLFLLNAKGNKVSKEADQLLNSKSRYSILNCGLSNNNLQNITMKEDEIRLLINIVADGSIEQTRIRWHLKKERKINHLEDLFLRLGYDYTKYKNKDGSTKINLNKQYSQKYRDIFKDGKKLPKFVVNLTPELVEIVLNEYSITDGCKNKHRQNSYQISSSKEEEIDILQEMFIRNGYRATKLKKRIKGFILTVNSRNKTMITGKNNLRQISKQEETWCVIVPNDTLIVRRRGKVSVTHNCHQLSHHVRNYHYIDKRNKTIQVGQKHFILTGSYLDYWNSYAQIKNMEPSRKGSPILTLDGLEHQIKVALQ